MKAVNRLNHAPREADSRSMKHLRRFGIIGHGGETV